MLLKEAMERIKRNKDFEKIIRSLINKTEDPYTQAERFMREVFK